MNRAGFHIADEISQERRKNSDASGKPQSREIRHNRRTRPKKVP
jgi:hypothetical protein